MRLGIVGITILAAAPVLGVERYPGQYADVDPDVSAWFDSQTVPGTHSRCCSDADGTRAEEELRGNRHWIWFVYTRRDYSVYPPQVTDTPSGWREVPESTIIRDGQPSPTGTPIVWYYTPDVAGKMLLIRCFKPGNEF